MTQEAFYKKITESLLVSFFSEEIWDKILQPTIDFDENRKWKYTMNIKCSTYYLQ